MLNSNIKNVKSVLQLTVALIYFTNSLAFANGSSNSAENLNDDVAVAALTDPELKDYFVKMEDFAEQLQKPQAESKTSSSVFGLKGQRIELLDKNAAKIYPLDKGQAELTKPAFTLLKYSSNSETKEFIIEAISGADEKGNNGKTVAKHVLSGFDVATVIADNLLVIIVEKNGNISAIPKSMIIHYGFEAPIPVFRKINGTPLKFNNPDKVKGEFLTIGSKPLRAHETKENLSQEREYEAGQLALWEENEKGERSQVKLLPMTAVLEFINLGLRYLNAASQLVTLDQKNVKDLESILKDIHENKQDENFEKIQSQLTAEEVEILSKYSSEKIKKSLSAAEQLHAAKSAPKDKFTMKEWEKEYSEMQKNAESQYQENLAQAEVEKKNNESLKRKILFFLKRNQTVDPEDFKVDSKNYQKFISRNESALKFQKSKVGIFKENLGKILKSKAVTYLMIGSPVLAFYSLPYIYDQSDSMKQVESLAFMYENIIPDVLKDHAYRTPLIISTVIQVALIPLVYLSAWSFKMTVKALSYTYKNSTTGFALKVKDFAARYSELSTTTVLLTLNVRFFSLIVTPYWKGIVESLLGQRTFFTAARKGLNPFQRISKDSEVAKELGLEKGAFVGLGLPLPMGLNKKAEKENKSEYLAKAQQAKEVNLKIQDLLATQKRSLEMTAWVLATKAISEKYQLDPASLYMAAELKQVNTSEVNKILADENLKKRWEILSDELIREFRRMDTFSLSNLRLGISEAQFAELYEKAKATALKMDQMSETKMAFKNRFLNFKKGLASFKNWALNLGEKESKFLKQVIPGKYVGQQVNQDFPVDQIMVSGISGVVGDMANPAKPEYLMADKNKLLYTSDAQMYSVSTNLYGHLVASAATLSLMNDTIKEEEEKRYQPREYLKIQNQEWSPNLANSAKSWIMYAGNPLKSDIGGLAVKRYITRMNTIFAAITFNLVSRVLISSQGLGTAFTSFAVGFFRSHMAYAWPWDFIQAGNSRVGQEANENAEKLKALQYKLSQGIREKNEEKSKQLIDEAYTETLEAYVKYNPKAIKELKETIEGLYNDTLMQESVSKIDIKNLSSESLKYIGLFSQLVVASKNNNSREVEKIKSAIMDIYAENKEINTVELRKLDAQGLLSLTQAAPPIPTKENTLVTWVTSILFGAILTTVLYTYLAPLLMDPTYLSQPNVVWDALLTGLKFTGIYYLVLGKKPWEFYIKTFHRAKNFLADSKGGFSLERILAKVSLRSKEVSGSSLMRVSNKNLCLKYY